MEKRKPGPVRAVQRNTGGFTLVELIVVLVILAILAALLVPALTGYIDKADEKKAIAGARNMLTALQTNATENYALQGVHKDYLNQSLAKVTGMSGGAPGETYYFLPNYRVLEASQLAGFSDPSIVPKGTSDTTAINETTIPNIALNCTGMKFAHSTIINSRAEIVWFQFKQDGWFVVYNMLPSAGTPGFQKPSKTQTPFPHNG